MKLNATFLLRATSVTVLLVTLVMFLAAASRTWANQLGLCLFIVLFNVYVAYYLYQRSRGVTANFFTCIVHPSDSPFGRRAIDVLAAGLAGLMLAAMMRFSGLDF